ncbi:MAG: hypothetical protein KDA91_14525 [Planctomycetaceae bacterium]|nr:hypothetical protein [Planctomycetaceae bacterium]
MSLRLEKPGTQVAVGKQLTTNSKQTLPLALADHFHNQQHNPFNNHYRKRKTLNSQRFPDAVQPPPREYLPMRANTSSATGSTRQQRWGIVHQLTKSPLSEAIEAG